MRNLMLRGRYLETKPVPFCHAACLSSCSESRAQIKGTRLTSKLPNEEHEDMPNRRGTPAEEAMMATADQDWRVNTKGDYEMHPSFPHSLLSDLLSRRVSTTIRCLLMLMAFSCLSAQVAVAQSPGTAQAWGRNTSGQLGDGTEDIARITPVSVSGLTNVTAIAAGSDHSLALLSDGTVMAWGQNFSGQLGDGTFTGRLTPVAVSGLTNVIAIAGGGFHSLALLSDGTDMAWGYNADGELGDGTFTTRTTPVAVRELTNVAAIAGGFQHSLALLSDGTDMAWGYNFYGQLGDGTTIDKTTPVGVSGLTNVTAIAAGSDHSLASF